MVNANKSKCMHFRKSGMRSDFSFKIGNSNFESVDRYTYLGVAFYEKAYYTSNSELLGKAVSRALGSIINKIHGLKDCGFKTYEKLYNSCVVPVLDYCSSVCGFKSHQNIDNVQNRVMRYFLGVHRFTPILAMVGDSGWLQSVYRRWLAMLHLWNRFTSMDDNRLTKQVFPYDLAKCNNNWSKYVRTVMGHIGLIDYFTDRAATNLCAAKTLICEYYSGIWKSDVAHIPKLRTYCLFKSAFQCNDYLMLDLRKCKRSILCQFRTGVLHIETGRYT